MAEYDKEMKNLAMRLMRVMLKSLGLDDGDVKCTNLVDQAAELTGAVRVNSCPACPDPDRAMGMAAHSDSSLVTILYQNGTSGLQVLRAGDESGPACWAAVPAVRGSLIVILGDLFQVLTNGLFRSAFHRALVNRSERRLSAAYFCGPAATAKVGPVAKLVDPARGPCYRAVTWPEYRDIRAELFQEALESLKM